MERRGPSASCSPPGSLCSSPSLLSVSASSSLLFTKEAVEYHSFKVSLSALAMNSRGFSWILDMLSNRKMPQSLLPGDWQGTSGANVIASTLSNLFLALTSTSKPRRIAAPLGSGYPPILSRMKIWSFSAVRTAPNYLEICNQISTRKGD